MLDTEGEGEDEIVADGVILADGLLEPVVETDGVEEGEGVGVPLPVDETDLDEEEELEGLLETDGKEDPEIVADGVILTDELLEPVLETDGVEEGEGVAVPLPLDEIEADGDIVGELVLDTVDVIEVLDEGVIELLADTETLPVLEVEREEDDVVDGLAVLDVE